MVQRKGNLHSVVFRSLNKLLEKTIEYIAYCQYIKENTWHLLEIEAPISSIYGSNASQSRLDLNMSEFHNYYSVICN